MPIPEIDWKRTDILIQLALEEDLGDLGDTTTNAVIPADLKATAVMIAKEELVCAGLPVAERLFHTIDPDIAFTPKVREGELCPRGTILAEISGPARALLTLKTGCSARCRMSACPILNVPLKTQVML